MLVVKAQSKNLRVPPRKARLVADLVRGLQVEAAEAQLQFCPQKSGRLFLRTLRSAIANAETRFEVTKKQLFIKEIKVDAGAVMKRAKAKNKGGRVPVMKRTSHFTVIIASLENK
jgi:large subunit ribosomal protein L22